MRTLETKTGELQGEDEGSGKQEPEISHFSQARGLAWVLFDDLFDYCHKKKIPLERNLQKKTAAFVCGLFSGMVQTQEGPKSVPTSVESSEPMETETNG